MNSSPHQTTFKILVLGQSNVGKTSIAYRFTDDSFKESYISTIGIDATTSTLTIEGEKIRLQIWDTAGQERFRTLTNAYYRGAMGIMLVYDVTCDTSFNNISNWVQCIEENASDNVICMLIGNKADADENLRCVTKKQGEETAAQRNMDFFEVSAKTGHNIKEAFTALGQKIYKSRLPKLAQTYFKGEHFLWQN
ncbi:uncharacterized protein LOC101237828 isoform X1 [Hydra vulgaris]|uniref:uncharacterized protein LOC101237828 isoform X1 n=1 Tax=Hydra vulgaris TaxID=6087 RepID=UPI000640E0EE|nr:ras-related protein RABE1a isoform X2 [Hydra vulgaris]